LIPWLAANTPFPAVETAMTEEQGAAGLLAAGADLSPERLLDAYRQGIFPWFSEGQPILWWSTDPRMVLLTANFKISPSLRKTLGKFSRDPRWEFRFDSAFEAVMRACAAPRRSGAGTWISEEIVQAYCALHRAGHAHSAEVWHDGALVGGAYGMCLGRMFYGESMFARVTDASKIALAHLVFFLSRHGVKMIDCQQETGHLASLGANTMPRAEFIAWIRHACRQAPIPDWTPVTWEEYRDTVK
jgi:leucyl/phenylalanyl-tRNA--protein transferase